MFLDILQKDSETDYSKRDSDVGVEYNRMEAGFNSMFEQEGEPALDTFFKVSEEQEELGYSPSSIGLKDALHKEETDMLNQGVQEVLLDPSVDLDTKSQISQMQVTDERPESTLPTKLGAELLMQEDETENLPETSEQNELRTLMIDSLNDITEYRAAQQAMMDGRNFEDSMTGLSITADIVQLMMPFVEQANIAEALVKVGEGKQSLQSFLLMGNAKEAFFDTFKRMPLDERLSAAELFLKVATEANRTGFVTNGLLEKQMYDELIYGGAYSDVDKWIDNLVSLVDLTILGKPIAWLVKGTTKAVKAGKTGTKLTTIIPSGWVKDAIRTNVSPVSPIRIASETNAEKAKGMFRLVAADSTDESAMAMGASNKTDVIGDAVLPEMHKTSGVRSKVNNIEAAYDKDILLNKNIKNALDESNVNASTRKEMDSAEAYTVNRMQEAIGVTSRSEMFQHQHTPTGAKIHGVYGPGKGGWSDSGEALDLTEIALREHGITRDNMYILERSSDTGEYVRVEEVTGNDFLVGVEYDYRLNLSDVTSYSEFTVSHNFLDRIPLAAEFSVNRHFFDPASILDPHLTLGANAAVDKSARVTKDFLSIGKEFAVNFGKANKASQSKMHKYILEANEKQIPHNMNTLWGEYGFNKREIETISSFREYWDEVWQVRNITDVRALRNQGYGLLEDAATSERFVAKPVGKAQVARGERVYDPVSGLAAHYSEEDLVKLYEAGDSVAKLRRPQNLGGAVLDQIVVRNDDSWRGLKDSDTIYPYREGYFQRIYTKPHYIVKVEHTDGGKEFERAIATADTIVDANVYIKRMAKTDPDSAYRVRGNIKDPKQQANFEQDTFETTGMSNQMSRGEKLIDSTAVVRGTEDSNVLSPVDAMIQSARSMGRKVGMSDFIAASKDRFMNQYGNLAQTKNGQPIYPRSMADIGGKGREISGELADARSTYEYISSLEFGYINGMDSIIKGVLKGVAEVAGERGFRTTEAVFAKAGEVNPTSFAKNLAFQAYIATNPFRQLALNAHQSTLLTSIFPKYVLSQKLAADMHTFAYLAMGMEIPKVAAKLTGRTLPELEFMWKEFQKSGLASSIDQNSMLRGALTDIAEANKFKGEGGLISTPVSLARKWGFDFGEQLNLTSAWLSYYNKTSLEKGGALDASDFGRISGNARNFTFNMNRAGEMPYNSNSLGLFFMYMQVPHKSLLQLTNRALTAKERTSVGLFGGMMWTLPPAAMLSMFGAILPDQEKYPESYQLILQGLEFYLFNKSLALLTGANVNVDFGNLSPTDAYGLYEFFQNALAGEVNEMLASTPAGQLLFGANPRITNFIKTMASATFPDKNALATPVTASRVWHDLASLSSGMSNIFRAKMALEYGKAYSAWGTVSDHRVSVPEAILQAFGFRTMDETQNAWVGMELYKKSKEFKDDVNQWYKNYTRELAADGVTVDEQARITMVLSQSFLAFGNNEKAHNIIKANLERDMSKGNGSVIFDSILKRVEYLGADEIRRLSNSLPDEGTGRHQNLMETLDYIRDYEEAQ